MNASRDARARRARVALAALAVLTARAEVARACGTSGPDGVSACSLAEHDAESAPRWRVGVSGVGTSTALSFSGGLHADETRFGTLATVAYSVSPRVTLDAGAGAEFGGRLVLPDGAHELSPGPSVQIGASWRVVERKPFVILTSLLSFTAATTRTNDAGPAIGYEAFDLRLGVIVGTTLWDTVSPYALARAFGGPVYWRYLGDPVTGTDTHHYQLGLGVAVRLARRVDLFVEGVPLGEQAAAAGVGIAL